MWQPQVDGKGGRKALLKNDQSSAQPLGGVLQDYSTEFLRLRGAAAAQLQAMRETPSSSNWADEAKAVERTLEEMESNRRQVQVQLRLELSGSGGSARHEWDQRLQEWGREITTLRAQLDNARNANGRRALRLSGGDMECGSAGFTAQHEGVMQSTEMLERSSCKLEEARRLALETEDIGQGVLGDLAAQRETILHTLESTRTIGSELNAARQTLNRLIATAQRNRLITLVIGAVLCLGLCFWSLAWLKLPLKWNLGLAFLASVMIAICIAVRFKLQRRVNS